MKNLIISCLLCVTFLLIGSNYGYTYANFDEKLEFYHSNKVFTYSLKENIKSSKQFDLNFTINKYNRFGSKDERRELLKTMLNAGIDKTIALNYLYPNLSSTIEKMAKTIRIKQKNASLKVNSNTEKVFFITNEILGRELDYQTLSNQICQAILNKKTLTFNLPTKQILPEVYLKDLKRYTNLRADFSTNISTSNKDRKHNIKNALASLNKVEIYPNQVFSFNSTVGKRTAENGYRQAKIIVNNEFVDGLGGGVCQVSTTLYNAALLAGLEIVEANKHSKQVHYVKTGFDAMVNFGSSDLKFLNNTSEKLTIITNYSATTARIRIFGEDKSNTNYKLTNEIFNIVEPIEQIFVDTSKQYLDKVKYEDEFFYLKTASNGMEIKTYREKYVNNQLVNKQLLRHDKYPVQDAIKIYGSTKRDENRLFMQEKTQENLCLSSNYSFSLTG